MLTSLWCQDAADERAPVDQERAARNHRSLQSELMAIIERAALPSPASLGEFAPFACRLGLRSPSGEAARMVREHRDDPDR